jgi:hypothetical protein
VRPDRALDRLPSLLEVLDERLEGLDHVPVAEVPALGPAPERRPVIALRVHDEARVLLCVELTVAVEDCFVLADLEVSATTVRKLLRLARLGPAGVELLTTAAGRYLVSLGVP